MLKDLLKSIIPGIAKKLALATDGKKTLTGAVLTAGGVGLLFVPGGQAEAAGMLISGVPTLVTGIVHKIIKHNKNKKKE